MNSIEYCELVERRLGWEAKPANYTAYVREAGKVNRKIATNPSLYTWANLQSAVELLARERQTRSPLGAMAHVDRALDLALDEEYDNELLIREATTYEAGRGDPDGWIGRFARATGPYRSRALVEWQQSTPGVPQGVSRG